MCLALAQVLEEGLKAPQANYAVELHRSAAMLAAMIAASFCVMLIGAASFTRGWVGAGAARHGRDQPAPFTACRGGVA